ncbi:uncharacterized protein BJX67DRAFT_22736 [Aspergillus lucknowensis]|uniref:Uncharacterized protein n=1 Tax=Aspergillus lucknowensis TaxID=176173 RepID=A0ABR4LXZ2_9EURO
MNLSAGLACNLLIAALRFALRFAFRPGADSGSFFVAGFAMDSPGSPEQVKERISRQARISRSGSSPGLEYSSDPAWNISEEGKLRNNHRTILSMFVARNSLLLSHSDSESSQGKRKIAAAHGLLHTQHLLNHHPDTLQLRLLRVRAGVDSLIHGGFVIYLRSCPFMVHPESDASFNAGLKSDMRSPVLKSTSQPNHQSNGALFEWLSLVASVDLLSQVDRTEGRRRVNQVRGQGL